MDNQINREPMLEMFIFETFQLIEQLEQLIMLSEKSNGLKASIDEIFRIMHTIKGSAAMMLFNGIASLAHTVEDLFYYLREHESQQVDSSHLTDLVLESIDFIKAEMTEIENGREAENNASALIDKIKSYLKSLQQESPSAQDSTDMEQDHKAEGSEQKYYIGYNKMAASTKNICCRAVVFFEEGCEMENIRAFTIIHNLKDIAEIVQYTPADIVDDDRSIEVIRKEGFKIIFKTDLSFNEVSAFFQKTVFLKDLDISEIENEDSYLEVPEKKLKKSKYTGADTDTTDRMEAAREIQAVSANQSIISVSVSKLDMLMDLVGELVISEAMVTQNPDLAGLELENFNKATRQLRKITNELQDTVMSVRMVPLSVTFQKMNRIVRDMGKKLKKNVQLDISGEQTEVDKNIIDHLSDPLMHLIRNSLDHGIESADERTAKGKPEVGTVSLHARTEGGEVWIIVKDDGKGLDRSRILDKARESGLVHKPESELTNKEIFSFIFLPGFSTNEGVTEFSGRGVGMDVVTRNIEKIGGTVLVDSTLDTGTTFTIKIPLTLAIIDGMNLKVGNSNYTIPIVCIKESFRALGKDVISDIDGNEMLMVRGECLPILRLHKLYNVKTEVRAIQEGIILIVENDTKTICLFIDELLGQQKVVVKALPAYIRKSDGIAGCTLLGDGSISLILDAAGLLGF